MKGRIFDKKKTLLISMVVILISTAIVVGGTYALFTDSKEIKNELVAGNLEIGMTRTYAEKTSLNAQGYLEKTVVQQQDTDITNDINLTESGANLFEMGNTEKIVPGSSYKSTVMITNKGDIAFDYTVKVTWGEGENNDGDYEALAKQIQITIVAYSNGGSTTSTYMLNENKVIDLGRMTVTGEGRAFDITAEFINSSADVNNLAKKASIDMGVRVEATQVAPPSNS